jgi:hypothetical protein
MGKRGVTLKPGDVVAVPRNRGGYYFVLHLASNRFGEAFGLFQGHNETPDITAGWNPVPLPNHVYTGSHLVKTGRWQKVGHREDLRGLFSATPEIYHSKADNPSNSAIGRYGSAETPEGKLRELSEPEATSIGLKQGTYRHLMIEEQFEQYMQDAIG